MQGIKPGFGLLHDWVRSQGLSESPDRALGTIFHDSFRDTPHDQVRMSLCLFGGHVDGLPDDMAQGTLPPPSCLVAEFEIGMEEFEAAWSAAFGEMNAQGYTMAANPYEKYLSDPERHPEKKMTVLIHIPVAKA